MIKIQITSPDIREMKGTGKTSGKPYHMRFQKAFAFTVDKDGVVAEFPDKFEIILEEGQVPYARGVYELGPQSIYINRDGNMDVSAKLVSPKKPA